jgi:hypothetical protein
LVQCPSQKHCHLLLRHVIVRPKSANPEVSPSLAEIVCI